MPESLQTAVRARPGFAASAVACLTLVGLEPFNFLHHFFNQDQGGFQDVFRRQGFLNTPAFFMT